MSNDRVLYIVQCNQCGVYMGSGLCTREQVKERTDVVCGECDPGEWCCGVYHRPPTYRCSVCGDRVNED
jgi:hypothetical protein